METYELKNDLNVFYVAADSFPQGIQAAFDKLYSMVETKVGRSIFGLSKPINNGVIEYRAALLEDYDGEANELALPAFVIPKGAYLMIKVMDYMQNIPNIGAAFQKLIQSPNIDPATWCVEAYKSPTEVWCMVRQND